jgi:hypothetical protein
MKNLVNKSALEKLKRGKNRRSAAKAVVRTEAPKALSGFAVGPGTSNSARMRSKNLMLDGETLERLDDLCYQLKKTLRRRVSASELIRAAFRTFRDLPEHEQLRVLAE